MKNIAIASLLGYTYGAAVLGPLPKDNSAFPKIATVPTWTTGSAGDITDANVKQGTTFIGPYRGYRGDAVVYPTQNVKKWASGDSSVALQAQSTTRTFYPLAAAEVGTYFTTSTSLTNDAGAAGYVICQDSKLAKQEECNGAVASNRPASGSATYYAYKQRVYMRASVANGTAIAVGGLAATTVTKYSWNLDILLHTFYHAQYGSTTAVTDGTKWCTDFEVKLDSADVAFQASNGFSGKTKCTWQISTKDGTKAPSFYMNSADYAKFLISYLEWGTTAGLGTSGTLPTADAASFHLGAYASTDTKVFVNPAISTTSADFTNWPQYANTQAYTTKDPSVVPAGSWGTAIYYPGNTGIYKDTKYTTDSSYIQQIVQYKKDENSSYNSDKSSYDTKKTTYNKAVDDEAARQKDFFKATFEPKIAIPTRPDPPTQPYAYQGPSLKCSTAKTAGLEATYAKQGMVGTMKVGSDNKAAITDATRLGYIVSSADVSASTLDVSAAAKVFGLLGQGEATNPNKGAKGWIYGDASSSNKPVMMISFFPTVDADTGLAAAAKFVKMTAKPQAWQGLDDYAAPGQPAAAEAPKSTGASYLKAGIAASALIAASLF